MVSFEEVIDRIDSAITATRALGEPAREEELVEIRGELHRAKSRLARIQARQQSIWDEESSTPVE